MANEIELKLALPTNAIARVLRHPLLQAASPLGPSQTLLNTYYDTPDLALSAQRVALRTRKAGRRWLQTVKCAATSLGGLSSRPEWEQAFRGEFDFSAIDNPAVQQLLEQQRERIVPLFTTNFRRRTLIHTPSPDVEIHLMLDQGEISAADRREEICELELELIKGTADDLFALACELAQTLPLRPYDESKAARGYRLYHATPPAPQSGSESPLHAAMTPTQALQQLGLQLLADWSANLNVGQLLPQDPECLHQQRVALRRLRAALRFFSPVWKHSDNWRRQLGALATRLGPAREWEVLASEVLARVQTVPDGIDFAALGAAVRQEADLALAASHASDYREHAAITMLNLSRELLALDASAASGELQQFAGQALRKAQGRAEKALRRADVELPQSLHALRITLKQLRYAAGFCLPLFTKRRMQREIRQLGKLTDRLGHANDQADAWPLLQQLSQHQPSLGTAAGFVIGTLTVTAAKSRQRMLRDVAAWLEAPKPWAKR